MSEGPRPGTATPDAAGAEPWRALVASLPDGVVVLDARGVLRELNSAFCALVGHPPDGLIGRGPPFQWVGAASQEPFEELIGRGLRGEAASAEITVVDAGGRTRTASVRAASFVSPEHGRSAALMFTDVTERKSLETTQRDSERRWRSIVENPFQFVVVIDRSYRYVFVNHVEPGIHLEELLGKATPFDFVEREFHALMKAALDKAFREGVTTTYDVYSPVLDQWTSNIVGPIFEGAEVTSLSILVRDTTAAKRAELALRRSQKLEMLGAMGSSIVGDLRGLLAPVVGNVGAMLREMEEQHPLFTRLSEVSRAISKASELMNRLEPFQREPADATESVNVAAIAADVLSRAFAASPDIRLSIDIAEDCPRVVGFPWQ
ncbi:MAG TPA: PAS domain S-box protein, partial [Polyangiaceae bacterium]|nr:PAS domain S-box protein [Polyangiaceae bacterium]